MYLPHLLQGCVEKPNCRTGHVGEFVVKRQPSSPEAFSGLAGRVRPTEDVHHEVVLIGKELDEEHRQADWKPRRVRSDSYQPRQSKIARATLAVGNLQEV